MNKLHVSWHAPPPPPFSSLGEGLKILENGEAEKFLFWWGVYCACVCVCVCVCVCEGWGCSCNFEVKIKIA